MGGEDVNLERRLLLPDLKDSLLLEKVLYVEAF